MKETICNWLKDVLEDALLLALPFFIFVVTIGTIGGLPIALKLYPEGSGLQIILVSLAVGIYGAILGFSLIFEHAEPWPPMSNKDLRNRIIKYFAKWLLAAISAVVWVKSLTP